MINCNWESGGEESERASKTEVSRQLVYVLGGQSEPDTDHQGCRGQIALASNGRQRRLRWHGTIEEEEDQL